MNLEIGQSLSLVDIILGLKIEREFLSVQSVEVRKQLERGVFDIEVIKQANRTLIETIEESLAIADEGKRARAAAVDQLVSMESELRAALEAAKSRTPIEVKTG